MKREEQKIEILRKKNVDHRRERGKQSNIPVPVRAEILELLNSYDAKALATRIGMNAATFSKWAKTDPVEKFHERERTLAPSGNHDAGSETDSSWIGAEGISPAPCKEVDDDLENIRGAHSRAMGKALQMLDTISNPEVLREYSKMVLAHAARLEKRIAEYEAQSQAKIEDIRFGFADKLSSLNKIIFENGQEKRKTKDRPFEPDYKDAEGSIRTVLLQSEAILPPPKSDPKKAPLPRNERIHQITEGDKAKVLAEYGITDGRVEAMEGFYDESTEITVTERIYVETRHKRQKYRVVSNSENTTGTEQKTIIVTAKGPVKLLDRLRSRGSLG